MEIFLAFSNFEAFSHGSFLKFLKVCQVEISLKIKFESFGIQKFKPYYELMFSSILQ